MPDMRYPARKSPIIRHIRRSVPDIRQEKADLAQPFIYLLVLRAVPGVDAVAGRVAAPGEARQVLTVAGAGSCRY